MKLFAYGTLQDPIVQVKLLGRILNRRPAAINGWHKTKVFTDEAWYPAIQHGKEQVWGSILEVDQEDFAALDEYEGSAYKRIQTHTSEGELVSVYILDNKWLLKHNKQKQKNAEQKQKEKSS